MKTIEEILARKAEIRTLLQGGGEVDVKALTEEVRQLTEMQEKLEARAALEASLPEVVAPVIPAQVEARQILGNEPEISELRSDFKVFLETRSIPGGSLKTDSGFVVIPEEIVEDILKIKEVEYNLDQYVTVKKVANGAGKYPVVRQGAVTPLPTVAELAINPELAVSPFFELRYEISTHRGYFLVSKEAIEDAKVDIMSELTEWIGRLIAATRNAAILNALTTGTPGIEGETLTIEKVDAVGVDGLKDAVNLRILPNYGHNVALMNQSAFNELDKLKDGNGRYLLQDDVKEGSGRRLLGARVDVVSDAALPSAGGKHPIIIGNIKDAIVLFDRSRYEARWTDYMHFGEGLMIALRQDVRILDEEAAVYLEFTAGAEEDPEGA